MTLRRQPECTCTTCTDMLNNTAVSQAMHNASCYNDYTLSSRATLCMLFADSLVLSAGILGMSEDESHFFHGWLNLH